MNSKSMPIALISMIAIVLLVIGGFFTLGGVVNTSSSIPRGLYTKIDKPLSVGRYVNFCPPNRPDFQEALKQGQISAGSCPDGFGKIMLKVAAKRKNVVTINAEGVYVNDTLLPNSQPLTQNKNGRPLPKLNLNRYELKEDEVLLMSDSNKDTFDGRYFGVIDVEQIDSVLSPLL